MKAETWRARVRIGGIIEGDPPMLAFSEIAARPDGKRKLISQVAQMTDTELLARARRQAHNGVEAEVIVEQHLTFSILKEFALIEAHAPVVAS